MELSLLLAIQTWTSPVLDALMIAFTWLGDQYASVILLTIVYWLWDKETGEYIAYSVLVSLSLNGVVKNLLRWPRPIGEPGVRSILTESAPGYSFPSAHTQTAASLYGAFAWRMHRRSITVAAFVVTALVGLSRMYLGLHWPSDVLAGYALGFLVSGGVYVFFCAVLDSVRREYVFLATAAVMLVPVLFLADEDFVKTYGLLAGFAVGVWLEHRFVNFSTDRLNRGKRLRRWALGIVFLVLVKLGAGLLLPPLLPMIALEYALVAFTAFFVCPALFRHLRW